MQLRRARLIVSLALFAVLALALPALAIPLPVTHVDLPTCDFLAVPTDVHELGDTPAFPPDERIVAVDLFTGAVACPSTDTGAVNSLIGARSFRREDGEQRSPPSETRLLSLAAARKLQPVEEGKGSGRRLCRQPRGFF